jgi:hypothetical protein
MVLIVINRNQVDPSTSLHQSFEKSCCPSIVEGPWPRPRPKLPLAPIVLIGKPRLSVLK